MIPKIQISEVKHTRGIYERQATMLSLVSPEERVPKEHPMRRIKIMADNELSRLSSVFD